MRLTRLASESYYENAQPTYAVQPFNRAQSQAGAPVRDNVRMAVRCVQAGLLTDKSRVIVLRVHLELERRTVLDVGLGKPVRARHLPL